MPDTRNRVESVFIAGKSPLTKPRLDNKRQKGEHNKPRRRRRRRKKKKKKKRRPDPKSLLIVAPTSFSEGDGGGALRRRVRGGPSPEIFREITITWQVTATWN